MAVCSRIRPSKTFSSLVYSRFGHDRTFIHQIQFYSIPVVENVDTIINRVLLLLTPVLHSV